MQTATSSYAAHNYLQLQQNFPFNADIQTERHNAVSGLENENSSPQDTLSLSPESKKIAEEQQAEAVSDEKSSSLQPLTEEEVQKVEELKKKRR